MRSDFHVDLYTVDRLLRLPEPEWLIRDFIHQQETVAVWGEPNGGKSFLVLDWALCVATGRPWLGLYDTIQAPVVYMAGEGAASLQKRIRAWKRYHEVETIDSLYFQLRPLPLLEEEAIVAVRDTLRLYATEEHPDDPELRPGLVVVDTLSQFFGGGDEVGPDMALFVNNLRRLSQEVNTSVLIVHHSNALGERERGHSALRGNVDVMFQIVPQYRDNIIVGVELVNDKQRDNPRTAKHRLALCPVEESLVIRANTDRAEIVPTVPPHLLPVLDAMIALENDETEKCLNSEIQTFISKTRSGTHKNLVALHAMKLIKHGVGKSYLLPLGRQAYELARKKRRRLVK